MDGYKRVSPEYPDRAVTEAACPQCGAPPLFKCCGQHGYIIHAARAEAWRAAQ